MNTDNFFGENENVESTSFLKRNLNKKSYTTICPKEKYNWSEIKSSLLVQEIYNNPKIHKKLVKFLQGIVIKIFDILEIDYKEELKLYMEYLPYSHQGDDYNVYSVAQSYAFVGDLNGLWNDFYALFNFIRFIWKKIQTGSYYDTNKCTKNSIFLFLLTNMFQQGTGLFIDMIRGFKNNNIGMGDNHVGISTVKLEELEKNIINKKSIKAEKWLHPGNQQCEVPYHGKYGTYMKKYKKNNDFYASLQCGISGSTQFILYMYLFSISISSRNPESLNKDIRNIITTAIMILIGDGGHNAREVMYGLVSTIILLYNFIQYLKLQLQTQYNNSLGLIKNAENIKKDINSLKEGEIPFKNCKLLLNMSIYIDKILKIFKCSVSKVLTYTDFIYDIIITLGNWEQLITLFYNQTLDFNIVGVYKNDIDKYDSKMTTYQSTYFNVIRNDIIKIITDFWKIEQKDIKELIRKNVLTAQLFFSLDNERFLLNPNVSFKEIANVKLKDTLKAFGIEGQNVLDEVNKKLEKIIFRCRNPSKKLLDKIYKRKTNYDSSSFPPFAFSKTLNKLN